MKATIHFTETNVYLRNGLFEIIASIDDGIRETFEEVYIIGTFSQTRAELLKLRLEAVIQKEAEEMYPFKNMENISDALKSLRSIHNVRQQHSRDEHISWWQSLIERLPSEEENEFIKKLSEFEQSIHSEFGWTDSISRKFNVLREKYKTELRQLLPSLPSTLSCEYSEENGKTEVKKIWI